MNKDKTPLLEELNKIIIAEETAKIQRNSLILRCLSFIEKNKWENKAGQKIEVLDTTSNKVGDIIYRIEGEGIFIKTAMDFVVNFYTV